MTNVVQGGESLYCKGREQCCFSPDGGLACVLLETTRIWLIKTLVAALFFLVVLYAETPSNHDHLYCVSCLKLQHVVNYSVLAFPIRGLFLMTSKGRTLKDPRVEALRFSCGQAKLTNAPSRERSLVIIEYCFGTSLRSSRSVLHIFFQHF